MRKLILTVLITALVFNLGAQPTVTGLEGLTRIVDAQNQGLDTWTIGLSFAGPDFGAEHMNDFNAETWNNAIFRLLGSWVPLDPLELSVSGGMGYTYPVDIVGASPIIGLWDLELGAKYTVPMDYWTIGAAARAIIPTHSSGFGPYQPGADIIVLGSTTLDIFTFHLNLGGRIRDQIGAVVGAGIELNYEFLNPYVEITGEFWGSSFPLRITPGIRLVTNSGISFFYSGDLGLNPDGQPVDVQGNPYVNLVSAGIAYSPRERVLDRDAVFLIQVFDAVTLKPVPAQITISDHYPSVFVLGPSGKRTLDVQPGRYRVTVSASGYKTETHTVHFASRRTSVLEVELEPDRTGSQLNVRIIDRQTGRIVPDASVSVAGITLSGGSTGEAQFSIPPGSYDVSVAAPGYFQQTDKIILSSGIPLSVNVSMLSKDTRISLNGIRFAAGSAELPPGAYSKIDDGVRVLEGNPNIDIEIQGHTDSQGSAESNLILSQRRAESVRDYMIRVHGISSSRLTARGYGESLPVASNDTESGRALNRRVELVVLP